MLQPSLITRVASNNSEDLTLCSRGSSRERTKLEAKTLPISRFRVEDSEENVRKHQLCREVQNRIVPLIVGVELTVAQYGSSRTVALMTLQYKLSHDV
jgi:hypothetical protein